MIIQNFIPDLYDPLDFLMGDGQHNPKQLRDDRDWRGVLPPDELQRRRIETSSCVSQSIAKTIASVMEQKYQINDLDFSERYLATLSGTTQKGNAPKRVTQTARKYGMIPETLLPFDDSIGSFAQYVDITAAKAQMSTGKAWVRKWDVGYDWVLNPSTRRSEDYERVYDALLFSPVPVSVYAGYDWNEDKIHTKPDDKAANHLTRVVGLSLSGGFWRCRDSYQPFEKRLALDYDFGYGLRIGVDAATRKSILTFFLNWIPG